MIKYIIVDDEPLAHDTIEEYCSILPHLILVKKCYNAMEAIEYLSNHDVDLLFLDLNLPKIGGFDFLKTLNNPPKTIVTTAYQEFALEGYELNISDYLLKPFSLERMVKAVNKALDSIQTPKENEKSISKITDENKRFFIKGDKKYHQISTNDIMYIEAYGNYSKLYLENELVVCHEKISHFETFLGTNFMRIHKSYIVSLDRIKEIEGNQIFIKEIKIPIGQTYRTKVSKLYN